MFPDGVTGKILRIGLTRQVTENELTPGEIVSDYLSGARFTIEYAHGDVPAGTPVPGKNSEKPVSSIGSSLCAVVSCDNRVAVPVAVYRDTSVPIDTLSGAVFSDKDSQKNNDRLNNVARLFDIQESFTREEDIFPGRVTTKSIDESDHRRCISSTDLKNTPDKPRRVVSGFYHQGQK